MRRIFSKEFWNAKKILVLVLIAAGLAVYANTFVNQMFWDDEDFVLNNVYVQNFSFGKFFSENTIAGAGLVSDYWRPVLSLVFSIQYQLWGPAPYGYHVINAAFHVSAGVVLYFFLRRLFKNGPLAFFTALFFLVHPLQTEAVSYVSSLGDSLSVFMIFAGLWKYLSFKDSGRIMDYALSIIFYIIALLSKETAIIMPGLIFLLDFFHESSRNKTFYERLKPALKNSIGFLAVAGIYILLRATALNFQNTFNLYNEETEFTKSLWIRILTFFRILAVYLGLLFVPVGLHIERSVEVAKTLSAPDVLLGMITFIALIGMAVYFWKKRPPVSFGILWFFIALSITSNIIVPINGLLYEHWLYLPMVGIFLALAEAARRLLRKFGGRNLAVGLLAVILVVFGVLSIKRNRDWRDAITFYNQTLRYAPESYRVTNNLAKAYAEAGERDSAEKFYLRAINIDPKAAVAYHNLANTYRDSGRTEEAIDMYKKAIAADPDFAFSYNALVGLYAKNKNYEEARELVETLPQNISTLALLARLAREQEDYAGAEEYIKRALELEPGNLSIQNALLQIRQRQEQ